MHVHVHMSYDAVDATSTRQSAAPAPMRLAAVKRSGGGGQRCPSQRSAQTGHRGTLGRDPTLLMYLHVDIYVDIYPCTLPTFSSCTHGRLAT